MWHVITAVTAVEGKSQQLAACVGWVVLFMVPTDHTTYSAVLFVR